MALYAVRISTSPAMRSTPHIRLLIVTTGCLILGAATLIKSRVVALDVPISQLAYKPTTGYLKFQAELLAAPSPDQPQSNSAITLRNTSTNELLQVYPANPRQVFPTPYGTAKVAQNAGQLSLVSWVPITQSTQADWVPLGRVTRTELDHTGLLIWVTGYTEPFIGSITLYTGSLVGRNAYGSLTDRQITRIAPAP